MQETLGQELWWGNTILDYIVAAAIILFGTLIVRLIKNTLLRKIKRWAETTASKNDNYIVDSVERFALPAIYYFIVYYGLTYPVWPAKVERILQVAISVVTLYYIIRLISSLIAIAIKNYTLHLENGEEKVKQLSGLMILINIAIWIGAGVFLIENLGYDVTTIITGLGIGGIAVALAAQNILGDLFNYFVIFFDRPFEVGDFIVVDDKMGTVEYIGIKTTRLRSLSGEQLVIGNSNLTNSRIHNFKRQEQRRVVFTIDIAYETPLEKLRQLPGAFKEIVMAQPETTFDRSHFAIYKEWSLRFEVCYFVTTADYNKYMDIQQEINYGIYGVLEQKEISFAIPTQKLVFDKPVEIDNPGSDEKRRPSDKLADVITGYNESKEANRREYQNLPKQSR